MGLQLSSKQADFYTKSNAQINLTHGSVRSGKTFITNLRWLKFVHKEAPRGKLLMSGHTKSSIKENVIDDLEMMLGKNNPNFDYKAGTGILSLYGRQVEVRGAEKIDAERAIRGRTYAGWYGDEITIQHPLFVKQAVTRCSAKGAKIFWTTNPDHPHHHIKQNFLDNPDMQGKLKSWHFLLDDNLTLTDEYKDLLKSSFSGVFYERNILGRWVVAEGLVYKDFQEKKHVISYEDAMHMKRMGAFKYYIGGIDWGYTHPMAGYVIGVTHDNRYVTFEEYYATEMQTEDLGRWFKFQEEQHGIKVKWIWADSAEPDRIVTLASQPFKLPVATPRKGIAEGLNSVMTTVRTARFLITSNCENAIEEFGLYRYPDEDTSTAAQLAKDIPLDEYNHAMDAIRYPVHNHEIYLKAQANKQAKGKSRSSGRQRTKRPNRR